MRSIKNGMEPVCLLRSSPVASSDSTIVGYFNPQADFETEWLTVDLAIHPDAAIQDRGALQLRLDSYEDGSVEFRNSLSDRSSEGWLPMYAGPHFEYPSSELHDQCETEFPIDFPDKRFEKHYESLATWSNLMTRPSVLCHSPPEWPPRFFAQLGGRSYPWVEGPRPEHVDCAVVLRTFAKSEPWVEVLVNPDGEYFVTPHIT